MSCCGLFGDPQPETPPKRAMARRYSNVELVSHAERVEGLPPTPSEPKEFRLSFHGAVAEAPEGAEGDAPELPSLCCGV